MNLLNNIKLDFNKNYLSPKRLVATISAILTFYSFARVGVLFFEALAIVREERAQDYELLELCSRGDARSSPKMREACLQARADRASPLLAKAIVYAVSTAFNDFSATVGSPFKFSVLLMFIVSSVALPVIPWARAMFGTSKYSLQNEGDFLSSQSHFIVMAPSTSNSKRTKFRRALGRHIPLLRSKPNIHEVDDEQGYGDECNFDTEHHMHQD